MEYSECLQKLMPEAYEQGKTDVRGGITLQIRRWRNALNAAQKGDFPDLPTIEKLQGDGYDWRCFINELLVCDAIRLVAEADGGTETDLIHHTKF
jgi:hypothetical protein